MKRFASLAIMMAMVIGLLPAHAVPGPAGCQSWEPVKVMTQAGEKYGYQTSDGAWAIQPQFDSADPFDEHGYAMVWMMGPDGLDLGVIDATGAYTAQPQFDWLQSYDVTDYRVFRKEDNVWGIADVAGRVLVPEIPGVDGMENMKNGISVYLVYENKDTREENRTEGLVDCKGNKLTEPIYASLGWEGGLITGTLDARWGMGALAPDGSVRIPFIYDSLEIMTVGNVTFAAVKKDGKYGALDADTGEQLLPAVFSGRISVALAVTLGAKSQEELWPLCAQTCEELGLQVTWYPQNQGLMRRYGTDRMLLVKDGKSGLFGMDGIQYTDYILEAIGEFNAQGEAAAFKNGMWGMVDLNGETDGFTYYSQYDAEHRVAVPTPHFVSKTGKDEPPYAVARPDGTVITDYIFWDQQGYENGYGFASNGKDGYAYLDANGDPITPYKYSGALHYRIGGSHFWPEGCAATHSYSEGFNLINTAGKELLPNGSMYRPWYAGLGLFGYVDKCTKHVNFVDKEGNLVLATDYNHTQDGKGFTYGMTFNEATGLARMEDGDLIDVKGNVVIGKSEYLPGQAYTIMDPAYQFNEGLKMQNYNGKTNYAGDTDGPWGFVDEDGNRVVPAIFDAVGYFDCGYASVLVDGVFGLLRNPLLTVGKTEAATADITFTDVPAGSWFEKGVMTCAQSGVMVGTGEGVFSPNATLTDAECAMLAYRIYDQAHGGDGSLMKMPEDYGYIKLVSEDGSFVHEGYAGDGDVWGTQIVYYNSHGYRLRPYGEVKYGPATVTFGGKEYRGEVKDGSRGSGRYPSDHFPYFEPEDSTLNDLIMKAYRIPPPDRWWADLVYTVWQKGWEDVFPYIIYGREAWRYSFAELLGDVTDLPKRFDVPPIPDIGERGRGTYDDQIYELYEAGVIGGVDAYGTFESEKTLTRAEAAVMVARILDESQRLTAPPRPMPTEGEGYTLTYLRDGIFADLGRIYGTYPYCVVGELVEGSTYAAPVGLLTLEGEYTPWAEEMENQVKVPYGWRDWGGLWTENGGYYRWSDGTPATEKFDWCGKIGHDGRGFVQKDGKLYCIQFDLTAEKAVLRPERPTVPTDAAEGTEYLYDFLFRERYGAKVDKTYTFMAWDEERKTADYYTLLMPVEGALEGAVVESIDGDGMTPYQLKRYKQDGPDGSLVVGVHSYPLDEIEYISYLWTDRPEVSTDWYVGVGESEEDLLWSYWGRANLRLIEKEEAELDWMSSHSAWDFDELYVWQPYTPENNDVRDITFYMKDHKVAAIEMTAPYELRYVYGHDVDEELRRADERRQGL